MRFSCSCWNPAVLMQLWQLTNVHNIWCFRSGLQNWPTCPKPVFRFFKVLNRFLVSVFRSSSSSQTASVEAGSEAVNYWSPRLARSLLFFVVDSVCRDVCLSRPFKSNLLFCFSMKSSHFWPSFLRVALYKTLFFDFWLRPLTPKNRL